MTTSPIKKHLMGIIPLCDGDDDKVVWDAIVESEKCTTAMIVDLRTFPRETVDDYLKRLYNTYGKKEKPKLLKRHETKHKI